MFGITSVLSAGLGVSTLATEGDPFNYGWSRPLMGDVWLTLANSCSSSVVMATSMLSWDGTPESDLMEKLKGKDTSSSLRQVIKLVVCQMKK